MKQHITIEQLNELSGKGKAKLTEYILPRTEFKNLKELYSFYPLLSIGQMLEFLDEQEAYSILNRPGEERWVTGIIKDYNLGEGWIEEEYIINAHKGEELCDALWEAVKEVLEK